MEIRKFMKQEDLKKLIGKVIDFRFRSYHYDEALRVMGLVQEYTGKALLDGVFIIRIERNEKTFIWAHEIDEKTLKILPDEETIIWKLKNI